MTDNQSNNIEHPESKCVKASPNDIGSMLQLNYNIYPPEWHVKKEYVQKILEKNPEVYNILKTNLGIKGIFSLFPLEKNIYDAILQGNLEETDLSEYLLNYNKPREVYLYLISLIVDIHDVQRKLYAKQVIKSIPYELKRLKDRGIIIKEIGAIAISADGEKILPKIGFIKDEELLSLHKVNYPVFRASVDNVINSIHT